RWRAGTARQAGTGAAAETVGCAVAHAVHVDRRLGPPAVSTRVRVVDPRTGAAADLGPVPGPVVGGVGRAAAAHLGLLAAAAGVPRLPAGPGTGPALARAGLPGHSRTSRAGRSGDLLRRRGRDSLGLSLRHHLGPGR